MHISERWKRGERIKGFLATTDRFRAAFLASLGWLYLFNIPHAIEGIGIGMMLGLIWAIIGLVCGDAFWGWRGLLVREDM